MTPHQVRPSGAGRALVVLLLVVAFCGSALAGAGLFEPHPSAGSAAAPPEHPAWQTRLLTEAELAEAASGSKQPDFERTLPVGLIAGLLLAGGVLILTLTSKRPGPRVGTVIHR